MFGSGRAVLSLRDSYRSDLRAVKQSTDFDLRSLPRIFHDEVGVYDEDSQGQRRRTTSPTSTRSMMVCWPNGRAAVCRDQLHAAINWQRTHTLHPFWYKPNVSPPKDWSTWDDLITAFAKHLVDRYGIDEVAQWYFEVWNEPNLDFWAGDPKQATYWELYDHAARAIKGVNPRLRVGGPATAQAAWVDAFIKHCAEKQYSRRFCFDSRLWQRRRAGRLRHRRKHSPRQNGLPRGR